MKQKLTNDYSLIMSFPVAHFDEVAAMAYI